MSGSGGGGGPGQGGASNAAGPERLAAAVAEGRDVIVFDWDGTLVDSIHAITQAIREAARDLGLAVPSEARARHVIGLGMQDALRYAVPDLVPARVSEFAGRYRYHFLLAKPADHPFEGVTEMLASLRSRSLRLAVATGKSRAGLDRSLAQTGLGEHFVTSRCADEGPPKPHPWMLASIAEQLGVGPERMVMVGDTSHDIGMAHAFGAAAIGVVYGAHTAQAVTEAKPHAIVASIAELASLLAAGGG
jgi:phosphoglycolate phosphatase